MYKRNLMYAEIDHLSIAVGLKELLISKGFTKADKIIKTDQDELTRRLGIDPDVARLVKYVAKKQQLSHDIRSANKAADT
ncbi:MAG TPA: hypothetical protein VFZ67_11735 [Nitrososphaera sp.]